MAFWNKTKKDEYMEEARRAKRRGEFDRAGDNFYLAEAVDEALEMYTQGGHHAQAAKLLEKVGKPRKAADEYVLAKDYRSAALLFQKVGDGRRASQLFEKMGEFFKAAQIEEEQGSYGRAAELYLRANHRERAAACYAKDGDSAKAAKLLDQHLAQGGASKLKEQAEAQWASCAELYQRSGGFLDAAAIWERIQRFSSAAEAYDHGGDASKAAAMYLRAGEGGKAQRVLERAPDGAVEPRVRAELHFASGEWLEAAKLYRELNDPGRAAACFEKSGDIVSAAEQYELAGELEFAADLLSRQGQHARASKLYESGMRFSAAAGAARDAGEFERAARLFTDAHEPVAAARCWRQAGDVDKTIALLQKVQPTDENYHEASIELAEAFAAKGLNSIAHEKYGVAIRDRGVDSSTIDAFYGLAVLHEKEGDVAKAITIHERIVAYNYAYRDSAKRIEALRRQVPVAPAGASSGGFARPSGHTLPGIALNETVQLSEDAGATPLATGGAIGRRYEIVGRLASTPRGDVYKAWDTSLGRTVVLKRLVPHDASEDGLIRRYVSEAQNASKLHHSNIATIYDAVELPEGRLIAMEYVFGRSVRDLLRAEGRLSPGRVVELATQILQALEYAHGLGVTHRNLRPENVLLSEKSHVKLTDFGMNRRYSELAAEGYAEFSPIHYLSPEQIRQAKDDIHMKLENQADFYSLGCVLYEMLVGSPPFTGPDCADKHLRQAPVPPTQHIPAIPAALETLVLKCLEKDPSKRPATARQALEMLSTVDFAPGQRIGERYELLKEIGTGGMGKVYVARDLELEETIAMKVLRPEFGADPMLEQRFIREIKLARRIVHPAVVKVYDFGKWKEFKYITMEYIEGISLDEYVRRQRPPDPVEVSTFAIQIAAALDAAHKLGVVHRDIKPQNVLITTEGRVKIVDFGIARLDQTADLTSSRHIIGSPKYMSPEQITGKSVDHRTDIYALGVVMYYCYTGVEPFTAADTNGIIVKQLREMPPPPSQVNSDLPPWVDLVVLKCIAKDPRARYQEVAAVGRDIEAHLSGSTTK